MAIKQRMEIASSRVKRLQAKLEEMNQQLVTALDDLKAGKMGPEAYKVYTATLYQEQARLEDNLEEALNPTAPTSTGNS